MLNLLIVDDEYFMQDFLSKMIDWESIGVLLVDIFPDGQQALDALGTMQIDIVITDVKMPNMDGLTLIDEGSRISPKTKFFVLSGYDDFEYVRQSYRLGAMDYFLKTELTPQTIYNSIANLSIESDEPHFTLDTKVRNHFNNSDYIQVWRDNQRNLNNIIDGNFTNYKNSPPLRVCVINLHKFDLILSSHWKNDVEFLRYAIINVVQEKINDALGNSTNDVFFTPDNELVLIVPQSDMDILHAFFRELSGSIMQCFFMKISGALSDTIDAVENIESAFLQAKKLGEQWFLCGKYKLIESSDIVCFSNTMTADALYEEKSAILLNMLDNMSVSNVLQNIPHILLDVNTNEADARKIFDNYYFILLHFAIDKNIFNLLEFEFETYNVELKVYGDLNDLNQWLKKIFVSLTEHITVVDKSSDFAIKYILKNYNKDISLTDVAEYIRVTPSYLSRMFYKWTGSNFAKYLNDIRISKAIELLRKTNYKIFEIAEMVGFSNTEHFSRTFKNIKGESPTEYLKNKDWKKI